MQKNLGFLLLPTLLLGLVACGGDEKPSAPELSQTDPDQAKTPSAQKTPETVDEKLADALADYLRKEQRSDELWQASLQEQIKLAYTLNEAEQKRIVNLYLQLKEVGGYPPASPEDAEAIHRAFCQQVASYQKAVEAYDRTIKHYTLKADPQRVAELRSHAKAFREKLNVTDVQTAVLADPQAKWRAERFDLVVDAKDNSQASRLRLDKVFAPGDVLYIFPNPEDTWYTGRYNWVDYRGRIGAKKAPTMKLKYSYAQLSGPAFIGKRLILTSGNRLELYAEDQWPEKNKGQIRVTVIAMQR